jgi:hypothetical protein
MYSPAAVLTMLAILVILFDVGWGVIPNPLDSIIPHFPTYLVSIMAVSAWFIEWRK